MISFQGIFQQKINKLLTSGVASNVIELSLPITIVRPSSNAAAGPNGNATSSGKHPTTKMKKVTTKGNPLLINKLELQKERGLLLGTTTRKCPMKR